MRGRVPLVTQIERTECGAACLAMVLGHHGCHIKLDEARRACGVGRDGVSAAALAAAARGFGLEVEAVRVDASGLAELPAPCVLFWEGNHFVVLERARRGGGADLADPRAGRRRVGAAELAASFSGVALTFTPGLDFSKRRPARPGLRRHLGALRSKAGGVALVTGSAVLLEVLGLALPAATQVIVDHVLVPHEERWLWPIGAALLATALTRLALTFFRDRIIHVLHMALDLSLMSAFTVHLLRLAPLFFDQRATGDLMSRVQANARLRETSTRAVMALLDGFLALGYAGLMLFYDLRLGAIIIGLTVVRLLLVSLLRRGANQAAAAELEQRGREMGVVVEAASAPEVIKAFGAESMLIGRYADRLIDRANAALERGRVLQRLAPLTTLFDGPAQALVLWWGGRAVMNDQMTIGVFAGFLTLAGLLRRPLESLVGFAEQISVAQGTLARIDDVLEMPPEPSGSVDPGYLAGGIELIDVSYAYAPHAPAVCDGISLRAEPGQTVAIVGPSGAGKSTLMRLMLGLLRPTTGKVRIDGRDLSTLDLGSVRAQIGVVLQEPFLFNDSIAANLCLRHRDLPAEALRRACWLAGLDELIDRIPGGFEAVVGEGGSRLSGGQRQRLSLARALVNEPRILLLDEATSSLDLETEAEISRRLTTLACTRVLIAHRLATVRGADRIFVVDQGRLVQQGDYATLSNQVGLFRQLAQTLV